MAVRMYYLMICDKKEICNILGTVEVSFFSYFSLIPQIKNTLEIRTKFQEKTMK